MKFPITIIPNFFSEPNKILYYSKELDYNQRKKDYPGCKTESLNFIDQDLFHYLCHKVMNIFYQNDYYYEDVRWQFHKITYEDYLNGNKTGDWIHRDLNDALNCIIYLTENEKLGTSFYLPKHFSQNINVPDGLELGRNNDLNIDLIRKEWEKKFTLLTKQNSNFNTAVLFDGALSHSINLKKMQPGEERITLNGMFSSIKANSFPVVRSKFLDL
jgi:hypothetical protein